MGMSTTLRPELAALKQRLANTQDEVRDAARQKRHAKGFRTARENLYDLVDTDSFVEYGQLAVAAQRNRREYEELQTSTAGDGIITGTCTINVEQVGEDTAQAAVIICDFSVLAGTQGYFHHRKLDRICEVAEESRLPVIMYTEGGGGRPGDTDVAVNIAGLNITSFATWAGMSGLVPRIAVNNGYCFAGNAVLFGCADITIATRQSFIGMAGPAMIEGGGLGSFRPDQVGPADVQEKNGVIDIIAEDEAHATMLARQVLGYFQGPVKRWQAQAQSSLRDALPADRRFGYKVRKIIETIFDDGSFLELRRVYGRSIVTGFARLEGRPVGLIANDCQQLGGAIDSQAAGKAARFLQLCDAFGLPVVSLTDTPGYMVGVDSERGAAVRKMSRLMIAGASIRVPMVNIILRKAYGLGAMAMAGGGFSKPVYIASWPTGECGAMGLEGAVQLGFKKELEAIADPVEKQAMFDQLLQLMYEKGKATEAASFLEFDAVIDPIDTRSVIARALASAAHGEKSPARRRNVVDVW
jgi:acetyl-CoA carboxylase carboxyltransferase component